MDPQQSNATQYGDAAPQPQTFNNAPLYTQDDKSLHQPVATPAIQDSNPASPGTTAGVPPQMVHPGYDEDISSPIHYTRDPHKLVGYLVPFPKPHIPDADKIPTRMMIYTPPPPPLTAPADGVKEDKMHKLQRKWQQEVRSAKESTAKVNSWKGVKSRATKGISWAMNQTTTSSLDFLTRVPGMSSDKHADDGKDDGDTTKKTVGLEEMVLIYPATMNMTQDQLRQEFVETMMRTKSKAQRDAVIATGLIPVSACVDILATLIWPFGGLLEIDSVWAYSSIRGAKTARSVTKRLHSSAENPSEQDEQKLKLTFVPAPRLDVLRQYLDGECHRRDAKVFVRPGSAPTPTEVLEAIGWAPSQTGGETHNWEDEQWETREVKEDIDQTMHKAAVEYDKFVKAWQKNPEKAAKK